MWIDNVKKIMDNLSVVWEKVDKLSVSEMAEYYSIADAIGLEFELRLDH